ncbi:MAG: OmpA family protein [Candidatus Thiodiazotropha sp. (ex Monitilora ramsayi)]|nr:OmpA family protein [Candidatus Thiodiazotropha sp. (ex Monitilora ramsayi)]
MGTTANIESPLESIAWYAWESDESESNWLLTYVDMLSVVLAMLVVLLGHMAVQHLQEPEASIEPVTSVESVEVMAVTEPGEQAEAISPQTQQPEVISTPESRLITAIETQFQGEIKVAEKDFGISLEIADVILFESGKADLLSGAEPVLIRLAGTLQDIGEANIAVEGHTDDRPILGGRFQSNWELAAARANAVTRFLLDQGFAAERLRSVSYADTQPVADNQTPTGRAENRRVNLRVDFL